MPPKPRSTARRPSTEGSTRGQIAWVVGGVALVAVGLVAWLAFGRGGDAPSAEAKDDARSVIEAAGCTLAIAPIPGNESDHSLVDPADTSEAWTSDPPTGGAHNGGTVVWGAFDEPVSQAQLVHNLEHGGVYIQYGDEVSDETVAALRTFYDAHQNGTILAPYPTLGDKVAVGAWNASQGDYETDEGVFMTCTEFDESAFTAFFTAFQFKGPERFDPDGMTPGSQ
jgi:hypothetical protein